MKSLFMSEHLHLIKNDLFYININMNKLKEQDKVVNQNENVQIIYTNKDEKENCEDCNNK